MEETTMAVLSATERHEAAQSQVPALQQRLRTLQQADPFERSDQDADELARIERRLAEMEGLLPSLHAMARQERCAITG